MKRALIVLGAALVLMVGGVVAYATTTPSTINACVMKSSGIVRVLSGSDTCRSTETPLSWNQQGVPGADGTNGVSGREIVNFVVPFGGVTASIGFRVVNCPTGKVVIGGGAKFIRPGGGQAILGTDKTNVTASYPTDDGLGWGVTWDARDIQLQGVFGIQVYAICVNAS